MPGQSIKTVVFPSNSSWCYQCKVEAHIDGCCSYVASVLCSLEHQRYVDKVTPYISHYGAIIIDCIRRESNNINKKRV